MTSRRWILLVGLMSLISGSHAIFHDPIGLARFLVQMQRVNSIIGQDQATRLDLKDEDFEEVIANMEKNVSPNFVAVLNGNMYKDVRGVFEYYNQGSDLGVEDSGKLTKFCFKFYVPEMDSKVCFEGGKHFARNAAIAMINILPSMRGFQKDLVVMEVSTFFSKPFKMEGKYVYAILFNPRTLKIDAIESRYNAGCFLRVNPLNATHLCHQILEICDKEAPQYDNFDACMDDVAQIPYSGTFPCGFYQGNSIGCRGFHTQMARLRPKHHCPHMGPTWALDPDGKRKCVDEVCPTYNPIIHDPRFKWFPIHDEISTMC